MHNEITENYSFTFNPNKIAQSLMGVSVQDLKSPDDSFLFDGDHYDTSVDGRTGLNKPQMMFLKEKAQADYSRAEAYWSEHYERMRTDWDFYSGKDQWTESARNARNGRPVLTFPILGKFVKRIVAETKKNPPAVQLNARENGDMMKADIGMGLVRYIEDVNGAKYAYSHALECAAVGGIGWIKGGFDSKRRQVTIKKVRDPFSYYIDPDSEEIDGSDAEYFISHYRKTKNREKMECYEYWWREWNSDTMEYEVYWALIEGNDVLDYGRFPSQIIPIFPVFGEDMNYEGERCIKGIVRDLQDAQRSYNYLKSQEVEAIALTPKAPIIYEEGSIPKEEMRKWMNSTKNPSMPLAYRMTNKDGEAVKEKPQFMNLKADTEWLRAAAVGAVNDLKEVTGIYDTALGSDSKELSGKAIIAKQITADAGQYTFTEHLQATIQQIGRWLVQIIPIVYEEERVIRIVGEDGKMRSVDLDAPMEGVQPWDQQPIDLDFNDMDISISSGSSYATRREAGVDAFQSIMQAIPNTATAIADLAVKNMDIPYAQEASERLYALLPDAVKNTEKAPKGFVPARQLQEATQIADQQKAVFEQIQAKMQARIDALEAELKNNIQGSIAKARVDGEYKLAVEELKQSHEDGREALNVQADVEKTGAKIQSELIREIGSRARDVVNSDANQRIREVKEATIDNKKGYSAQSTMQQTSQDVNGIQPQVEHVEQQDTPQLAMKGNLVNNGGMLQELVNLENR